MIKTINDHLYRLDSSLILYLNRRDGRSLTKRFFYTMSRIGDGYLYIAIGLLNLILFGQEGRFYFFAALIAYLIELPVYAMIKKFVKRSRPFMVISGTEQLIAPPDEYSFPSGHTAAAFLMARILAAQFAGLTFLVFMLAGIIGFSRIYLRVHYPSDVLAGCVLGLGSAHIALSFVF